MRRHLYLYCRCAACAEVRWMERRAWIETALGLGRAA